MSSDEPATARQRGWEYKDFVHTSFNPKKKWVSLSYQDQYVYPLARQSFWQDYEAQIRAEIQRWQQAGWEPTEPLSPAGLNLKRQVVTDHRATVSDVVLWVATLGVAFLVTVLLGGTSRRYVAFEPLEFRVTMRRSLAMPTKSPAKAPVFQSATASAAFIMREECLDFGC